MNTRTKNIIEVQRSDLPHGMRHSMHALLPSHNEVTRFPDDARARELMLARRPRVGFRRPKAATQHVA